MTGDDPYVYPGTGALRSLLGITDSAKLNRVERRLVVQRAIRRQFQDIYEWAGELQKRLLHSQTRWYFYKPNVAKLQIGRSQMSRKSMIALTALFCLMSVVNGFVLFLNTSAPSRAAVAGMSYQDLIRDPDFTRAVKSVVQECKVNIDIAKLMC